jgi:NAD(P)-dependent dehydrogenase (short-subunit alcohol dehydrogenase family)
MTTRPVQYDFSGKVVVITGGSRGIGHAMALGFAAAGARLAIASRKLDTCEATVKEIRSLGAQGSAHATRRQMGGLHPPRQRGLRALGARRRAHQQRRYLAAGAVIGGDQRGAVR